MQAQEEKETEMMTTSSSASESDEETLAAMATAVKENQEKGKGGADKGEEEVREEKRSRNKEPRISTCFSTSRMKRLIRSCVPDYRITPDAIFLFNKASELFLELFAEDAFASAVQEHKRSINYGRLSSVVYNKKRYEFLSDFVPEKVRAKDALSAKALTERQTI